VLDFLKKIFNKKNDETSQSVGVKTAPLTEDQLAVVTSRSVPVHPSQFIVGVGQSVGRQRDHNEDTLFVLNTLLAGTNDSLPFGVFIVADGMGGHQNGEVASMVATRAMESYLVRKLFQPLYGLKPEPNAESFQEIMQGAVNEAQQAVLRQVPGGGTTLTATFILGEQVTLAHIGDSRAYLIYPDGRMQVVTRDHSLVRRLIELGQITEKEAMVHPQRSVLYRALGQGEPLEADISTFLLPRPGYLMLCSDGLWGVVPDIDIFQIVSTASHPSVACQDLIDAANRAGGPDNISVVLIQYPN
jgi:serine/threonine protein phosphatase PrpC